MIAFAAFLGSCVAERTSIAFPRISGALQVTYDAVTVGTLTLGDDGCLYLRSAGVSGPVEELLLWPASYEPKVDRSVSIVGGDGVVLARVGDRVVVGGGHVSGDRVPRVVAAGTLGPCQVGRTAWAVASIRRVESSGIAAGPVAPMNEALVAGLARQGITIEDTSAEGAIPPAEAVATARIAVPLVADAAPTESLVLFTDEVYGPEDASGGVQPLSVELG